MSKPDTPEISKEQIEFYERAHADSLSTDHHLRLTGHVAKCIVGPALEIIMKEARECKDEAEMADIVEVIMNASARILFAACERCSGGIKSNRDGLLEISMEEMKDRFKHFAVKYDAATDGLKLTAIIDQLIAEAKQNG